MKINQISAYNTSFKSDNDEQKAKSSKAKENYFVWVSQNQANKALFMTKDREEKNGKLMFAETISAAAGVVTSLLGIGLLFAKKLRTGVGFAAAGLLMTQASNIIKGINITDASRTAEKRGFTLGSVNMGAPRSLKKAYEETAEVYDNNVKK